MRNTEAHSEGNATFTSLLPNDTVTFIQVGLEPSAFKSPSSNGCLHIKPLLGCALHPPPGSFPSSNSFVCCQTCHVETDYM